MRTKWMAMAALSVCVAGCGNGASSPSAVLDLTGTWSGDYSHTSGNGGLTWQIVHSGAGVTGTMIATNVSPAVVYTGNTSGTLSGTTLAFSVDFPAGSISTSPNCTGSITGTATAGSRSMTGIYSGRDCFGPFVNGRFTLSR